MCSKTEHVIELLHTLKTIERPTDNFCSPDQALIATRVEHMFDI